jgi:acyl carrier protein
MTVITRNEHLEELREMIAEVLEFEPEEISDTGLFVANYDADSLSAIEILARIEKEYRVEIPQEALAQMLNLRSVHDLVKPLAGWRD